MLSISLLCVGKLKERYWREACAEYVKRLGGFCKINVVEVDEQRLPERPSVAEIGAALKAEGARLPAKIPAGTAAVALCVEGQPLSSAALAEKITAMTTGGVSHLAMVIGSSHGLDPAVKQAAALRLSFSPMTFPHQLARVMALEQLYRAMQIHAGGRYHK
ncbi:MAG: 23S rRNA (pseudouridine(1915)-N(3))-methyltransferase RlmH [Oscillospiraceae bacterium]|nr:23S rRNA (pseudouridine(1915)-N(3))-methyltransferase RlmH [Oscillospiraceae bacterium]